MPVHIAEEKNPNCYSLANPKTQVSGVETAIPPYQTYTQTCLNGTSSINLLPFVNASKCIHPKFIL